MQAAEDMLRLYWMPGCTSCLRAREFLKAQGLAFESINVIENPAAADQLRRLGARSVPVVARGERFVFAQELSEVARFVGISLTPIRLPPAELLQRLRTLLEFVAAVTETLPAERLADHIPTRPRRYADLCYHVGQIVEGLLDAADPERAAELTYAHFERLPDAAIAGDPQALARALRATRAALENALSRLQRRAPDEPVRTYYGLRPLHEVLERTAWHVAQHARQIDHIAAVVLALPSAPRLDPRELVGLPVPQQVWDAEVQFVSAQALDSSAGQGGG
jgi:glutaredoxin